MIKIATAAYAGRNNDLSQFKTQARDIADDVFPILLHLSLAGFRAAGTGDVDGNGVAMVLQAPFRSISFSDYNKG